MRALIRMDDRKLADSVELSLKNLGYSYYKNQGRNVTEFEVHSPCHMIVSVENLAREQFGFPFRSPVRIESAIELRRTIGASEPEERTRQCSAAFVNDLRSSLPDEPWKGLGVLRSRAEKQIWERLGEL